MSDAPRVSPELHAEFLRERGVCLVMRGVHFIGFERAICDVADRLQKPFLDFMIKKTTFMPMIFTDSAAFSRKVYDILTEDELIGLERLLVIHPAAGDLIPGSRGLRKIRVASGGKGKRGGSRVIYYWYVVPEKIQFCRIYEKSSQANLSKAEVQQILTELDP